MIYDDCQGYQLAVDLRSYHYRGNSYFRPCCVPSNLIKKYSYFKRFHITKEIYTYFSFVNPETFLGIATINSPGSRKF